MLRNEGKFYAINFIDPQIVLTENFNTTYNMKTHIQELYKKSKSERRRCVQGL